MPTESWAWTISPREGVEKEGRVERVPAHIKAETELPVGSQGRDGQRGGKKIRRKRSHICLPASFLRTVFRSGGRSQPAVGGWSAKESLVFPPMRGRRSWGT